MAFEKLKNNTEWMEEDVKDSLKNLQKEVLGSKEKIPQKVIDHYINFYNKVLEMDIKQAKEQGLTSKEEKIVRNAIKRFIEDIKNHPNAYIMPLKKLSKLRVEHSTFEDIKDVKDYWFIDNFDYRKTLWAKYEITDEEEMIVEKYNIWHE